MYENGLNKFYWGFVFIMISFRIMGFDIFPDIVGYLLFASGFSALASSSVHFGIAAKYNIPMIILSVFSIFQSAVKGDGIQLGIFGILSIPIAIATFILNLLVVYHLFMGIKDMVEQAELFDLAQESIGRWNQYRQLQFALLLAFIFIFIPPLALVYMIVLLIVSIALLVKILGFLNRCKEIENERT